MNRRKFLITGTAAGAGVGVAAPAVAQNAPAVSWRLSSSVPRSLNVFWQENEFVAQRVSEMTEGKFKIQCFAAGEIVPGLAVLDAVQNGTIECGQTISSYYVGKDPAFAIGGTLPCGFNSRQQNAWMLWGGGREVMNEFWKQYNVLGIPAGNSGAQLGGWFRKELKSLEDFKGLKMRISGLGGHILQRLGVVPQQLPASDIYASLERGTIDAAEWGGPYDDEKLGFYKVAPFAYYPSWQEGNVMVHLFVNLDKWNALPKSYQAALETATLASNHSMFARYDMLHTEALRRLIAAGAKLRAFPQDMLTKVYATAYAYYDELAEKNENFKKLYGAFKQAMNDTQPWQQVGEFQYDAFVNAQRKIQ